MYYSFLLHFTEFSCFFKIQSKNLKWPKINLLEKRGKAFFFKVYFWRPINFRNIVKNLKITKNKYIYKKNGEKLLFFSLFLAPHKLDNSFFNFKHK